MTVYRQTGGFISLEERGIIEKALVSRKGDLYIRCYAPPPFCLHLLKEKQLETSAILVLFCHHTSKHLLIPSGITGQFIRWQSVVAVPEGAGILLFHTHPGSVIPSPSAIDYSTSLRLGWNVVSGDFFLSVSPLSICSNLVFYYDPENLIAAKMQLTPLVANNSYRLLHTKMLSRAP